MKIDMKRRGEGVIGRGIWKGKAECVSGRECRKGWDCGGYRGVCGRSEEM